MDAQEKDFGLPGVRLAPVFQDLAVLQRGIPIPVWGCATPGTGVWVRLAGHRASAVAGPDGRWSVRLPALPAGGPHELHCGPEGGGASAVLRGLLVGEVWLCSGQSNMEFRLSEADPSGMQCRGADFPDIRMLAVSTPVHTAPQPDVGGVWTACTPASIARFSAVAGWFGRELHARLGVPVGLISNAWGGTRIQAWMSRRALVADPTCRAEVEAHEEALRNPQPGEPRFATADEWFRACGPENPENLGERGGWHRPDFADAGWPTMEIPCRWQDAGHGFSGVFWFRRRIPIPSGWLGRDLDLRLGAIDKHDETYANGHRIGGMGWENKDSWCTPRHYRIPAGLVGGAPELVLAVRVRSHIYHGGMTGPAETMNVSPVDRSGEGISLRGPWRFAVEQNWGNVNPPPLLDRAPGGPNAPGAMHLSRVAPVVPYGIRGVLWYQGESNTGEAGLYRRLLPTLVADLREAWGLGALPFLQVQLANFNPALPYPAESAWAQLRAAQAAALADPQVGMAVAIDVGEAGDIHPKDKKTVGLRLCRWALSRVYGHPVTPSGPLLRSAEACGGRMVLRFDHAVGLHTRDGGPVAQIAIAGPDRVFVWAESEIIDGRLEVWHSSIPQPVAVRYAWADNPEGCNLVNSEGLPAAPFDTAETVPLPAACSQQAAGFST